MNYSIESPHPLKNIQFSMEKQLGQAFRSFMNLIMGNKKTMDKPVEAAHTYKRNYFLEKYQQLLEKGKTGNVQVVKVEQASEEKADRNNAIYLSFQMITEQGVKLFTAAAMAPKEKTPSTNTVIPIFYNPDDFSVVVLL